MSFVPSFLKHGFLKYTGRGVAGLWAVLSALEKPGCDVIMPTGICEIVPAAVIHAGMKPVFCDVNPLSGNSEYAHYKKAISKNTAACIVVHNYGTPLDALEMESIQKWTQKHNFFLVEDVCNACGAEINGIHAGAFGDAAFYSFGYAKIIDIGTGGALVVNSRALYKKVDKILEKLPVKSLKHTSSQDAFNVKLKTLRTSDDKTKNQKIKELFIRYMPNLIHRPDSDIIKKILQESNFLSNNIKKRRRKSDRYAQLLNHSDIDHLPKNKGSVCWRHSILVPKKIRDVIIEKMREKGFHASAWYPPVHHLFHQDMERTDLPGAAEFGERVINLWVDDNASLDDIAGSAELIIDSLSAGDKK